MKNLKLSIIFNEAFKLFIIFLISYIWCLRIIKKRVYAIILAIAISIGAYLLINFFIKRKNKKSAIKSAEQEKVKQYTSALIFNTTSQNVNFFYDLASTRHKAEKRPDFVKILHPDGNVLLFPIFKFASLTSDDVIAIYNKTKRQKTKRIVICTNTVDQSVYKLCEILDKKICLLDYSETYSKLLKEYNLYPEIKEQSKKLNKTSYKDILTRSLNKSKAKGYFVSSLCLLFSSFFVRYSIYYIIVSTLLLVLSLISFFNPKYNKPISEEIL